VNRDRKSEIVEELTADFRSSTSMLVADPRGLTVAGIKDLRIRLREQGATFRVSKNTLARIAAREAGQEPLLDLLEGPTGIALCHEDPAPVAKAMADFARTSRLLEVRGGVLEGRVIDAATVRTLATLPPREELYAKLVGSIASPISGFVNVIAAIPRGLVVALDQIRQQKEAAA
jgi:large subunit ribosomal protein L10